MRITKDEARILAEALNDNNFLMYLNQVLRKEVRASLLKLEKKLDDYGKDKRRQGRTSMNDFSDCLKRYAKTKEVKNG